MERLPDVEGTLDPDVVDALLVSAHAELQRLWEEFLIGARVKALLLALVRAIESGDEPIRIVDVGCGTGYIIRWLAAHRVFDSRVKLVGVDYNAALVACAEKLAAAEELECEFHVANAFRVSEPTSIFLSTGVLHHFRGAALDEFFRQQASCGPSGFIHFDIQPTWLAPVGAWLFHRARMRQALARHDGYASAIRAHSGDRLLEAARQAGDEYRVAQYNRMIPALPMLRTMHAVIGVQRRHQQAFTLSLGRERLCLGDFA